MLCGFDVRILFVDSGQHSFIFEKVGAALDLIHAHDARRFDYLRRDLGRISVAVLPGAAAGCLAEIHICAVDFD